MTLSLFPRRFLVCTMIIGLLAAGAGNAAAQYDPAYAQNAMVAGPEPLAVEAGVEIMRQGGNAFDAAAAIGFALAVTYPVAGNIGGGGFMVAYTAEGEQLFLDFREMAPQSAFSDMYLNEAGELVEGRSTGTLLAVGVPGTPHGLLTMQGDYGVMPRESVLQPAVDLAQEGFETPYSLHASLEGYQDKLMQFESSAEAFYPEGEPPAMGDVFAQPDLAATLKRIQGDGISGFYEGETARLMAEYMSEHDGLITEYDMARYHSKYRDPVVFDYKDYQLITPNLPSSGGITMAQVLKLVEPFPLQAMGYHSAEYINTVVEAERLAFADRNHYHGDRDFVDVPVEGLLSEAYLDARRREMPRSAAGDSEEIGHGNPESEQTTHFCVVDEEGNVVAITYTVNSGYGMGAVVDGAGFVLNNEMDDFTAKPGEPNQFGLVQSAANEVAPGKRPLSAMTPTIVLQDGEFAFTMGTPGGPTIITTNIQIFLNKVEFGMNIREAIDSFRFHHQHLPDVISHEPRAFSPDTEHKLLRMGYTLRERRSIGFACGIERTDDGLLAGHSDARGAGKVAGY